MQIQQTEYIRSNRTVICHVYVAWNGEQRRYTGVSTCHPFDKFDLALGKAIAWERAYGSLVSKVRRWTQGQINHREHNIHQAHKPLHQWEQEMGQKAVPTVSSPVDPDRRVPRYKAYAEG